MAINFKFKIKSVDLRAIQSKMEEFKKPIDRKTAESVGETVIEMMKDMISKGISPIAGESRFSPYKNPKKYPGKKKGKRPVNLKLTGEFLDSLTDKAKSSQSGYDTEIGFYDKLSQDKEKGHREGAGGQPKRPIIPSSTEKVAVKIEREVLKIYKERLNILKNK